MGAIAGGLATRLQSGRSVTDLSGAGPFALIPYPQFSGGTRVLDSNDFSTYHALEAQIERRFTNGFSFQASYTFSKSLDTRSYDPSSSLSTGNSQAASSTPFDVYNRKLNYARSDFDRTHALQSNWVYELPFGKGKRWGSNLGPVLERVAGGWEVAGFFRLTDGRPFTVYSGAYTLGNVIQTPAQCNGCKHTDGRAFDDPSGMVWFFNDAERATFSIPAPGQLGNTARNGFTGPRAFNIDMSLLKRVRFTRALEAGTARGRHEPDQHADVWRAHGDPKFGDLRPHTQYGAQLREDRAVGGEAELLKVRDIVKFVEAKGGGFTRPGVAIANLNTRRLPRRSGISRIGYPRRI